MKECKQCNCRFFRIVFFDENKTNTMSLFPAYEKQAQLPAASDSTVPEFDEGDDNNWLSNSSFQTSIIPRTPVIQISSDSSDNESVKVLPQLEKEAYQVVSLDSDSSCKELPPPTKRIKRHKKSKKHSSSGKHKPKIKYELDVENVYFEDRTRDRGNCRVDSLCSRARPLYNTNRKPVGFIPYEIQSKKSVTPRYFASNLDVEKKSKKLDTVIKRSSEKKSEEQDEKATASFDCLPNAEEEQKSQTKDFNEKLGESPHDIDLWLRYIKFQDLLNRFEKSQAQENYAALCQRKLSIADRGLERNPESRELLREKLFFMSELYPADEFSAQVETLVNKDTGNIMLWQSFIMATQTSVAMCTVPKVMSLYNKFFGTLRLWSRTSSRNHDERLLEMLYQCFIFLRQAGLWEQMWEALRLNLSLNLGLGKEALRFQRSIDEKKLIEMEEVILTSRLPLNQLWLRVESLRENCHWISVDRDQLELIGDSHRFVSPEDITDYVHPMLTRDLNMKMAIYALMTLKVPLLPTTDYIIKDLGLEKSDWTIDSIESILPLIYPSVGEMAGYDHRNLLLKGLLAAGLTSGPQYLRYHPAQEPYLDFVRDTFRVIAENLSVDHRTSLYVWWLRFERMLVYLCKEEPKSDSRRKKLKALLKEFLKKGENRNNLHFYREYALIEREMGRHESCKNILETAIDTASVSNDNERGSLLSLRRTLIESLLDVRVYDESKKLQVIQILCQLVPGIVETNDIKSVEEYLREYYENFLSEPPAVQGEWINTYFLPNYDCDTIACYVYLLYVDNRDISNILEVFDACLKHTRDTKYLQERFYENEIAVLQLLNERSHGFYQILVERLNNALDAYPDNFYLLSVFAGIEIESPSWKLQSRRRTDRPWQALTLCLAGRARIHWLQERDIADAADAAIHKLIYFHRRVSKSPETQHCPLAWRFFMLLLREHNLSQEKGEEIYHESVAQCPWARSIYIDAAEVAPQVLTQIQDVIREKDLRMHVTPEELDILRG